VSREKEKEKEKEHDDFERKIGSIQYWFAYHKHI